MTNDIATAASRKVIGALIDSGSKGTNKGGNLSGDREKAAEAGKKGGQHSQAGSDSTSKGGNFATDREKASEAGKKGGEHSHGGNK